MAASPGRSARSPRRPQTKRVSPLASNSSTDPIVVGRVRRAHGLDGSVVVDPETDDPDGRFRPGSEFCTTDGRVLVVRSRRRSNELLLVRFEDHEGRDAAEALRGAVLTIPATDRRPLGEDEYWPDELVGFEVVDEEGRLLGRVAAVIEGSAQDRLAVATGAGAGAEVPFVAALVPHVDVANRRITVRTIPGLMDRTSGPG